MKFPSFLWLGDVCFLPERKPMLSWRKERKNEMLIVRCNSCGRWIGKEETLGTVMEGICSIECCPECKCTEALMDVDYGCNFSDDELKKIWELFGDVCVDDEDSIQEEFIGFPEGTDRLEIWHWFDERYSKGVSGLIHGER